MATAADIISKMLRLFGVLDETETAQPVDLANNVAVLNDLLRSEMADGAAQFLMKRIVAQIPAGVSGQIYSFSIGTADPAYLVQADAVAVKSIWVNDVGPTVNRETRMAPLADIVRTTFPGMITRWHPERQADGSVLITAGMPPRAATQVLIDYGGRLAAIAAVDGSDVVGLPPEGVHDAALLLGRRVYKSYGVAMAPTDTILRDAEAVNSRWRTWARGQQWIRFVRS